MDDFFHLKKIFKTSADKFIFKHSTCRCRRFYSIFDLALVWSFISFCTCLFSASIENKFNKKKVRIQVQNHVFRNLIHILCVCVCAWKGKVFTTSGNGAEKKVLFLAGKFCFNFRTTQKNVKNMFYKIYQFKFSIQSAIFNKKNIFEIEILSSWNLKILKTWNFPKKILTKA